MNYQIAQRFFITLVVLSLIWLLCLGPINLMSVQEVRSIALSDCLKDNFQLFDLCYRKTNDEIRLTLLNYISPFIPVILLVWVAWLFKLKFQIDVDTTKKRFRKFIVGVLCFIGALGFFLPFYIVLEKEIERLYAVLLSNLFLIPWLAISWISIPIFYKNLLDKENQITEFGILHKVIYCVAASPFIAVLLLLLRQEFQF